MINGWFFKNADAKLAAAKAYLKYKDTAQKARKAKEKMYLEPYKGQVLVVTVSAIESQLKYDWFEEGWKA
ncbi:MAG: hypothetical protein RMK97_04550 [Sutterellaceae bacterium]|nr:hypothetical protein [Burkholderiaceae bacterium]MCX7900717.1 hypothetical protein [Burkholderiaceae bacterium]MDW8429762.1 hypothetical protein [Sutterellaceae bacterium]